MHADLRNSGQAGLFLLLMRRRYTKALWRGSRAHAVRRAHALLPTPEYGGEGLRWLRKVGRGWVEGLYVGQRKGDSQSSSCYR